MSRKTFAAVILVTVVASVIAGWVAKSAIRSPADVAAETAPPAASPILVPAESRVLSTDIVSRGTGRFGSPQNLLMATSALKGQVGVVTTFPLPGATLAEGDVALTASGRPLFVLEGALPVYRDLGPGREGDDVRQLQEALSRLGFFTSEPSGIFDTETEAAVAALYANAGYAPYETTLAQLAEIQALSQELSQSLAAAAGTQTDIATAEVAALAARARLNLAYSAVGVAEAEFDAVVSAASADLAAVNNGSGSNPLHRAEIQLRAAVLGEQAARDLLEIARRQSAASPWSLEFAAAEAAAEAEVLTKSTDTQGARDVVGALTATGANSSAALGSSEVSRAQNTLTATTSSAQQAIAAARTEVVVAQAEAAAADAVVEAARLAKAPVSASSASGTTAASLLVERLEVATSQVGVLVPADEVVFVTSMPVRVAESLVGSGDTASGPVLVVTNSLVSVDTSLALDEAPLVQAGMAVQIDEPALGLVATGVVARVAASPGTNGVDGFHVYVEVLVDDAPPNVVGVSARINIPVESTGGAVLSVPIQAVTLSADGSSRVQRETPTGLEFVTVGPGLSADGFVGVTPINGTLTEGDRVVIGFDQATHAATAAVSGG